MKICYEKWLHINFCITIKKCCGTILHFIISSEIILQQLVAYIFACKKTRVGTICTSLSVLLRSI
jgi:hypothetical protein